MERYEAQRRQTSLEGVIKELSYRLISDDEVQDQIMSLKSIYCDDFRHTYSNITALIVRLNNNGDEHISNLCQNLSDIIDRLDINENKEFIKCLNKLVDHIRLEEVRIGSIYREQRESIQEIKMISETVKGLHKESKSLNTKSTDLMDQSKNLKIEVVTILSIFAAILLAMVGSISFTSSVLQSMNSASIYRVTFIAIISGLVVFNTIGVLLYIISKIVDRSIYSTCKTEKCTCNDGEPKCNAINRIRKRMPYIFYFNFFAVSFLVLIIVAWYFDLCGLRDIHIGLEYLNVK